MSKVDKRIVDMHFNNKQFEKGVRDTVNSLDDLKKGLDLSKSSQNLSNLQKQGDKFSLSNIATSVQSLSDRFSTLGIIGMTAIQNITNSAIKLGKKLTSAVMTPLLEGGKRRALNIEQAKFQFEGLGMDVEATMADASYAVDGTAYSLDAAAKVASQLGASGMRAGEDMRNSLRAVSGVAAMAGSSYEDIGNVFTKVAGQGRLMGDDLLRLSSRGINAAATIAKELNKTEAEVRDMVTKGEINFQIFSEAMDSAFGEHATAANKTFTGALSNVGSALARIGENVYTPLHNNLIGPLNDLRLLVNEVNKALTPMFENLANGMAVMSGKASKTLTKLNTGWAQVLKSGISDAKNFEEVLKEVGKAHGIAVDEIIEDAGDFQKSLKKGWVTEDILSESVTKLTELTEDAFSEVTKNLTAEQLESMEDVRKHLEELQAFQRAIKDGSASTDDLAKKLASASGMANLVNGLTNALKTLQSILEPVREAFLEVFPPMAETRLYELTVKFKELTEKFKIGASQAEKLKTTFKGLFSLLDTGIVIFVSFVRSMKNVLGALAPVGDSILNFTSSVGEMLFKFNEAVHETGIFATIFEGIAYVFRNAFNIITKAISSTLDVFSGATDSLKDSISFNWLETLGNILTAVGNAFKFVGSKIKEMMQATDLSRLKEYLDIGVLLTFAEVLRRMIVTLDAAMSKMLGILATPKMVNKVFAQLRNSLIEFQTKLKMDQLQSLAISIGILAGAIWVLSTIDPDRLAASLGAMTVTIGSLLGSFKIMSKIDIKKAAKTSGILTGLATAVLILSFAMKNFASLDWPGIGKGLTAITVLMAELVAASLIMSKNSSKMVKGSVGLVLFSTAIVILSKAVEKLGSLSLQELGKGLGAFTILLAELVGASLILSKNSAKMIKGSVGLVLFSSALLVLANVVKTLGALSLEELGKGLGAFTVLLGSLIGASLILSKNSASMMSGSAGLILFSAAMVILSKAVQNLGSMNIQELGKGLLGMAVALRIIIGTMYALPKGMMAQAASLLIVSTALVVMSKALQIFGNMGWENIGKAGTVLAGSLALIAGAMYLMTGALPGAAALLVVSAALLVLTPTLLAFGAMPLNTIGKSLLMLAGVFTVFGVASLLLGPIIPLMLGVGAALLVMGAGVALAGVGILALGAGITALAAAFTASGGAIFSVVRGFLALIPELFKKLGEGIVAFVKGIADSSDAIFEGVAKIIVSILQAIIDAMPKLFEAVTVLLVGICDLIIDTVPKFIEAIFVVLTTLIDELVEFIPKFVDASTKIMTGILTGIAENITKVAKAGSDVVIAFLRAIGDETPRMIDAGFKMIIDFVNGLADSIRENTPELITAGQNLADALLRAIADVLTGGIFGFSKKGKESGEAYEGGMAGKIKDVKTKAGELATEALEGLKSKAKEMYDAGVDGIKGFILGLGSKAKQVWDKTKEMGTSAVIAAKEALDSNSPSKEFIKIGQSIAEGMSKGITNSTPKAVEASEKSSEKVVGVAKNSLEEFRKWLDEQKFYSKMTMEMELASWEGIASKYKLGSDERKKVDREIYTLRNELRKRDFEEAKYYNQITLQNELEYWKETQALYAVGTDKRLEADREVYRIQKEIKKKELDDDLAYMEERKYYNDYTLNDELWYWLQIQARYEEGSDERKKADREVYRLRNELMEESYQHSLNWIAMEKEAGRLSLEAEIAAYERIKSRYSETDEEYTSAVKAQTQARIDAKKAEFDHSMDWIEQRKYYGELTLTEELAAYTRVQQRYEKGTEERIKMDKEVFRVTKELNNLRVSYDEDVKNRRIEIEQEYADKTKSINEKLREDIKRLTDDYKNALSSRTKAIYDSYGLFDKVEARKAVSGSTLMKNLQDQVDDLDKWQKQLSSLSAKGLDSALIDELQEMGPSAMAELEALNSMSSSELAQYTTLWSTKHEQAKTQATKELEGLRTETRFQITTLRSEANSELDKLTKDWSTNMGDIAKVTDKKLIELRDNFNKQTGIIKTNTEADFREMTSNVKEVMRQAGWNEMGQQIVDGLSGGIDSRKQSFIDTIIGVIQGGILAVQNVADMHSPSRVFAKMGRYMDEGLVVGLKQYSNRVVDASADVGREAIDSMSNAISGIGSIVNSDMDIAPTIRPVMDMTDFRSGLSYMDTALTADRSMLLGVTAAANQNGTNSYIDELASKLSDANTQSNNKITSAIEGLKSDFAGLVDKVTKLQVVMDTGTLVGAIGPDMDRELGGLSNMTRRGVR